MRVVFARGAPDGTIPASVHYRPASDPKRSCGTCSYFGAGTNGRCGMWDAPVEASATCDEWAEGLRPTDDDPFLDDLAAAFAKPVALTAAAQPVPASTLNRHLAEGMRKAEALEPELAAILERVLDAAADDAARSFARRATDHLSATGAPAQPTRPQPGPVLPGLSAAAPSGASTMLAVFPRATEQEALAKEGGEPAAILHCTLAFLGEIDEETAERVAAALVPVAAASAPLAGAVGGVAAFAANGDKGSPSILLPDVPGLAELRTAAVAALDGVDGADAATNHGWTPHITVSYEPDPTPPDEALLGSPLHFDDVLVVRGDEIVARHPLTGGPVTAAAPSPWGAPAANEIIDVDSLVQTLRTKTDPVRLAVVKDMMTPPLEGAGLSFDVTQPLAAKVLAQSGSQITNIAETTRLNAMRVIRASHEQGLSIPDTAKAIRAGMKEANKARATLIARTELVGATNGGSLAAVRIVEGATGSAYTKTWRTSPGAQYPRHEDYDGLDGQTTSLEGLFQVGSDELEYPGDPSGDPGEVCNCRCTMTYSDGEETDADTGPLTPDDEAAGGGEEGEAAATAPEEAAADEEPVEGPPITDAQVSALSAYADNGYEQINGALRSGTLDEANTFVRGWVKDIDAAFRSSDAQFFTKDVTVHRAIHSGASKIFDTDDPRTLVGKRFVDEGYQSASMEKFDMNDWTTKDSAAVTIDVPRGVPAIHLGAVGASEIGEEEEILLPRGLPMEILSASKDEFGVWEIRARVVQEPAGVALAPLDPAVEQSVRDALAAILPTHDPAYEAALRYGRKVAKVATGARASTPSLGGLDKELAARVSRAVKDALVAVPKPPVVGEIDPALQLKLSTRVALTIGNYYGDDMIPAGVLSAAKQYGADYSRFRLGLAGEPRLPDLVPPGLTEWVRGSVDNTLRESEREGAQAARQAELAATRKEVAPGSLAADIEEIRSRAEWLTPSEAGTKVLESGNDPTLMARYSAMGNTTPVYAREMFDAVLAAGARMDEAVGDLSTFRSAVEKAEARAEAVKQPDPTAKAAYDRYVEASNAVHDLSTKLQDEYAQEALAAHTLQGTWADTYLLPGVDGFKIREEIRARIEADGRYKVLQERLERLRADKSKVEQARSADIHSANVGLREAKAALAVEQRKRVFSALSELRSMGPTGSIKQEFTSIAGVRSSKIKAAQALLTKATGLYPTDWVARFRPVDAGINKRGYHSSFGERQEIKISTGRSSPVPSDEPGFPTALHELGHEAEDRVPFLLQSEKAFYEWRTRGRSWDGPQEPTVMMSKLRPGWNYRRDEVTREDEFSEPYMGKAYGSGRAYELFTMGMEGLMSSTEVLDPEYRQWMLGVLALLG